MTTRARRVLPQQGQLHRHHLSPHPRHLVQKAHQVRPTPHHLDPLQLPPPLRNLRRQLRIQHRQAQARSRLPCTRGEGHELRPVARASTGMMLFDVNFERILAGAGVARALDDDGVGEREAVAAAVVRNRHVHLVALDADVLAFDPLE